MDLNIKNETSQGLEITIKILGPVLGKEFLVMIQCPIVIK